jgi:glycosyltransferase involved in cell wall biosynthesis
MPDTQLSVPQEAEFDVSIVIPLFNEAESLEELHERISRTMNGTGYSFEIIYINDGSTDGSGRVLEGLAARDPRAVVVDLKRNFGKSNALMAGFHVARGARAVTMDADLQDLPENVPLLLAKEEDLVSGWRQNRKDSGLKKFLSLFFNKLVHIFFGLQCKDINCGFKAYTRNLYKSMNLYGDMHRMTLVLAHMEGYSVAEVPVEHAPRKHGKSKYPLFRARGLWDIISLSIMRSLTLRPFHFFAPYSVLLGLVAIALALLIVGLSISGYPSSPLLNTALIICVVLSVNFFLAGLQFEAALSIYQRDYPYEKTIRRVLRSG